MSIDRTRVLEGRFGLGANAPDHRAQAVGPLWREMLVKSEFAQGRLCVDGQDVGRAPARIERENDGDEATNDMGV